MTPKEKAIELYKKFKQSFDFSSAAVDSHFCAKLHAKFCVTEVMEANHMSQVHIYPEYTFEGQTLTGGADWWRQVIEEIEKI
jgi:hypothetical protein